MARKLYEESKIAAIGEKIREKTGGEERYTTAEMPSGVDEVFNAGKRAEYDRFWDAYQNYGRRTDYSAAYGGNGWTNAFFKPKYDMIPTTAYTMFCSTNIKDLRNLPVKLDFSKSTSFQYMFQWANTQYIGVIDTRSATTAFTSMFSCTYYLKSIEKLIFRDDGSQKLTTDMFVGARALEELNIEGVIGTSVSFKDCAKLNKASIISIINALSDTATGQKLILSRTAVENAFAQTIYSNMESKTWTESGITFTCDGNGTFTVDGTCDGTDSLSYATALKVYFPIALKDGEIWTVKSNLPDEIHSNIFIIDHSIDHSGGVIGGLTDVYDFDFIPKVGDIVRVEAWIREGQTVENLTFTPCISAFGAEWKELKDTKPNWTISLV